MFSYFQNPSILPLTSSYTEHHFEPFAGSVDAVKSTIVDEALLLGGVCGALADGANELLASVSPNQDASSLVKQVHISTLA